MGKRKRGNRREEGEKEEQEEDEEGKLAKTRENHTHPLPYEKKGSFLRILAFALKSLVDLVKFLHFGTLSFLFCNESISKKA